MTVDFGYERFETDECAALDMNDVSFDVADGTLDTALSAKQKLEALALVFGHGYLVGFAVFKKADYVRGSVDIPPRLPYKFVGGHIRLEKDIPGKQRTPYIVFTELAQLLAPLIALGLGTERICFVRYARMSEKAPQIVYDPVLRSCAYK